MRKLFRVFLLTAALATALCVSVMAADEPSVAGLYGFEPEAVSVTAYTEAGAPVAASDQGEGYAVFYQDAARFDLTYASPALEAGEQCLLLICGGTGAPTEDNIVYINQEAAEAGSVCFANVFPSSLGKGEYRVYIVSAHSAYDQDAPTATFRCHVPYRPGDVDDDKMTTANDALWALMMSVDKTLPGSTGWTDVQRLAADVDGIEGVSANDALWILEASVDKRVLSR